MIKKFDCVENCGRMQAVADRLACRKYSCLRSHNFALTFLKCLDSKLPYLFKFGWQVNEQVVRVTPLTYTALTTVHTRVGPIVAAAMLRAGRAAASAIRAAGQQQRFLQGNPDRVTASLFPGDGIGPEICESVKQVNQRVQIDPRHRIKLVSAELLQLGRTRYVQRVFSEF